MGIQIRDLVRTATKYNLTIARHRHRYDGPQKKLGKGEGPDRTYCVYHVLEFKLYGETKYCKDLLPAMLGVSQKAVDGLEAGFEGWDYRPEDHDKRYYRVGRRFAEKLGLA
jgi:hypothetical protein